MFAFIYCCFNLNRYDTASKERRRGWQKLLLRVTRANDERHRRQRIPRVRYARRGLVRYQIRDDTADTRTGPDGDTGRGTSGEMLIHSTSHNPHNNTFYQTRKHTPSIPSLFPTPCSQSFLFIPPVYPSYPCHPIRTHPFGTVHPL